MGVPTLRSLANELLEKVGLRRWVEQGLSNLWSSPPEQAPMVPPSSKALPAERLVTRRKSVRRKRAMKPAPVVAQLLAGLEQHPRKDGLRSLGQQKDQLLRSLVPLYLAQGLEAEVTSGVISRFWQHQGVHYAPPNAAKALRKHEGFSQVTGSGRRITALGVEYVETALDQGH